MKKLIISLVAIFALMGAVYGAAASFTVTSDPIGAGSDTAIGTCATSATVAYTTAFVTGDYELVDVTVATTGGCTTEVIKITLTGSGTIADNEYTGAMTGGAETFTVSGGSHHVADLADIHVLIEG